MEPKTKSRGRDILEKTGLVVTSVALVLLIAEAATRIGSDEVGLFTIRNFAESKLTLFQSAYPAAYDPELGWAPKPGFSSNYNVWKTRVTIDKDGLRYTGELPKNEGRPILAVGDSFTFGDEVNDDDAMPARLQDRLQKRVLNGGVFGYGIDQAVMRGERLVERFNPEATILMVVPDDITRVMLRVRTGVEKPYFDLKNGKLERKGVPVSPERPSIKDVGLARKIFGYSYLVDWTFRKLKREGQWYIGNWPHAWAHGDRKKAEKVSCLLMNRLLEKLKAKNSRGIAVFAFSRPATLFAPSHEYLQAPRRLRECVAAGGWETLDLHPIFKEISKNDRKRHRALYQSSNGHFSRAGNDLIAEQLERILKSPKP